MKKMFILIILCIILSGCMNAFIYDDAENKSIVGSVEISDIKEYKYKMYIKKFGISLMPEIVLYTNREFQVGDEIVIVKKEK